MQQDAFPKKILVTGATGYIGGRLIPQLLTLKLTVTVLVRSASRICGQPWASQVNVIEGDLCDAQGTWSSQLSGFDAAYYLVHSLQAGANFDQVDAQAAHNFGNAVRGTPHVIYLGGLLPQEGNASEHLMSRAHTGKILAEYVALTEFRAGPIIGSGSASFEMLRYLTERLPIMVTPKWVTHEVQPIAIRNVLAYLIMALKKSPAGIVEIGANRISFKAMMEGYARIRRLKRVIIPLPVLTPWLAAHWVGAVTPIPNKLAIPLIKGIVHPVLADTKKAQELFPNIHP
ncbi:MAG TPA: NAD(P)H-binding protein, partial [Opitutales bacterium]|nr:NAD(P)H-binding protein [Opitutales bacterium]